MHEVKLTIKLPADGLHARGTWMQVGAGDNYLIARKVDIHLADDEVVLRLPLKSVIFEVPILSGAPDKEK